jgi:magnesium and cobalt transporter
VPVSEGLWECDARAELDDVAARIDPRLGEVAEAVDTLGGLTYVLAEQVPPVGTCVAHPSGWTIEVVGGDETHVTRLRLHAPAREEAE